MADWFIEWARWHCDSTAADAGTATALVVNRSIFTADWLATEAELRECTRRLVSGNRTPKFANEHGDAVGIELRALRQERAAAPVLAYDPSDPTTFTACPTCGDGRGWVVVPHPRCVVHGELTMRVITVAVICEDCEPGRRALAAEMQKERDRQRPTLAAYTRRVSGADGVALLRGRERRLAALARGGAAPGAGFAEQFPRLAAKLAGQSRRVG